MVRALILDIGGVIAHDVWENLVTDGLLTRVHLIQPQILQRVGAELWDIFAHRPATNSSDWKVLEEDYWISFVNKLHISVPIQDLIELSENYIKPIDGILNLLDELDCRELKLGICSNNTEFWFERQWSKLSLYNYFHPAHVVLSSRTGVSKSSPGLEMFRAVVSALDVEKEQCIFIDDREKNVERALEYGLTSILFPRHLGTPSLYLRSLLLKLGVL